MHRVKWYYVLNILVLSVLLTTAFACDEITVPERETSPAGLPVINEFYADPQEVMAADDAILHWNVSGASTVTIEPNVGEVTLSGERGVAPLEDTTYILTASNEVGSVTASTEVIGCSFIATVIEELPGLSEQPGIVWIDPDTERPMLEVAQVSDSLEPIEPPHPPERLEELPSKESSEVLPIIRRFEATPNILNEGGRYVLVFFDVPNADEIVFGWSDSVGARASYSILHSGGYNRFVRRSTSEGLLFIFWVPSSVASNIECILRATNSIGQSWATLTIYVGEQSATVKPIPTLERVPPVIHSFNANPANISAGDSSKLSWEVSNADTVTISDATSKTTVASTGSMSVTPSATTTYRLAATNSAGSQTQYITVNVKGSTTTEKVLLPIIHSFTANPATIAMGTSSKLSWDVSNADTITITAVSLKETASSNGSMSISPTATTTYKLTATNSAGSQSHSVTVIVEDSQPPKIPEQTEKSKPDLVITDTWRSGTAQWHYIVKNQGKVECSGSSSELRIDGKSQASQSISPLAPGESREFYFSHKFACEGGTSHTWAVVADVKGAIDESDEDNNSRTEKFICSK